MQSAKKAFIIICLALVSTLAAFSMDPWDSDPKTTTWEEDFGFFSVKIGAQEDRHNEFISNATIKVELRSKYYPTSEPLTKCDLRFYRTVDDCSRLDLVSPRPEEIFACKTIVSHLMEPGSKTSTAKKANVARYNRKYACFGDGTTFNRKTVNMHALSFLDDRFTRGLIKTSLLSEHSEEHRNIDGFLYEMLDSSGNECSGYLIWTSNHDEDTNKLETGLDDMDTKENSLYIRDLKCKKSRGPLSKFELITNLSMIYKPTLPHIQVRHTTTCPGLFEITGSVDQVRDYSGPSAYNTTVRFRSSFDKFKPLNFNFEQTFHNLDFGRGSDHMEFFHSTFTALVNSEWSPEKLFKDFKILVGSKGASANVAKLAETLLSGSTNQQRGDDDVTLSLAINKNTLPSLIPLAKDTIQMIGKIVSHQRAAPEKDEL